MLSDDEREALGRAMNILKHKVIDNVTIWDLHTLIHYPDRQAFTIFILLSF